MKHLLSICLILLVLFYFLPCQAACRAKIYCKDMQGNKLGTIHLKTYRHGFLYHKCSVIKEQQQYLTDVKLRRQLCNQQIKGCQSGEGCRAKLIFKHSWPLWEH